MNTRPTSLAALSGFLGMLLLLGLAPVARAGDHIIYIDPPGQPSEPPATFAVAVSQVKAAIQYSQLVAMTSRSPVSDGKLASVADYISRMDESAPALRYPTLDERLGYLHQLAATSLERQMAEALENLALIALSENKPYLRQAVERVQALSTR